MREVEEHVQKIGVLDLKTISKWKWCSLVNKYVLERTKLSPLEEIKGYKKLSYVELSKEKFERKAYFSELSLEKCRMAFRVKNGLVPTIRKCYPRKYRAQGKSLSCPSCTKTPA